MATAESPPALQPNKPRRMSDHELRPEHEPDLEAAEDRVREMVNAEASLEVRSIPLGLGLGLGLGLWL